MYLSIVHHSHIFLNHVFHHLRLKLWEFISLLPGVGAQDARLRGAHAGGGVQRHISCRWTEASRTKSVREGRPVSS